MLKTEWITRQVGTVAFSSAARSRAAFLRGIGSVLDISGTGLRSRRQGHATVGDAWARVGQNFRAAARNVTGESDDPEDMTDAARRAALTRLMEIQVDLLERLWEEFCNSDELIDDRHYPIRRRLRDWPYRYPRYPYSISLFADLEEFHYVNVSDPGYWSLRLDPELERYLITEIAYFSRQQDPPVHFIAYLVQLLKFVRFEKQIASSLSQHTSPGA